MLSVAKYFLTAFVGVLVGLVVAAPEWTRTVATKALGRDTPCSWRQLVSAPVVSHRLNAVRTAVSHELEVTAVDLRLGIEAIQSHSRIFWIKKSGADMSGIALLGYIIAEQRWITEYAGEFGVRPGDVVVDVGAHVGTFGDDALRRGAARVIMVEPDPVNVECIRRNFSAEIAQGKVTVIPEGAWSKTTVLKFRIGVSNSGTGSFVLPDAGRQEVEIPVRPLDEILRSVGVDRVDFIKMDIEGAEREALRGAAATLARWKPRLMLDMYHLPDDAVVLPPVISQANPAYRSLGAVCVGSAPYATFFQ